MEGEGSPGGVIVDVNTFLEKLDAENKVSRRGGNIRRSTAKAEASAWSARQALTTTNFIIAS